MPAPDKAFFENKLGKSLTDVEYSTLLNKGGWSATPAVSPYGPGQFPVEAPPPGIAAAPSGPNAPPLLASLSPGAASMWEGAPAGVQSSMTPVSDTTMGAPNTAGAGLAGQVKKAAWMTGASTEDGPGFGAAPRPDGAPAGAPSAGPLAPAGGLPPKPAMGGGGGGGGGGSGLGGAPTLAQLQSKFLLPGEQAEWERQMAYEQGQVEKQKKLMDLEITSQEAIAAEQLGATKAYAAAQQKQVEDDAAFQDWHSKEMQALQGESDKAAAMKLDSNRMFRYANTGDAVLAGVAMALGAIGGAMAQTTGATHDNPFVTSLNKAIERDLAQQQVEIEQAKSGVARKEGILSQRYKQYGDMKVAKNAAALDAYKIALVQLNQKAALMGTEAAKLNAEKAGAALQNQIDSKSAQHDLYLQAQWKQYQQAQAQAAAAAAWAQQQEAKKRDSKVFDAQLDVAKKRAGDIGGSVAVLDTPKTLANGNVLPAGSAVVLDAQGNIDVSGTDAANKQVSVPTVAGFSAEGKPMYGGATLIDKGDKKVWDDQVKSYTAIKQQLKIIEDLRKKHGGGALPVPWNADDRKAAEAAASNIHGLLKGPAMLNLGAVSGTDMKFLTAQVPEQPLSTAGPVEAVTGQDPYGTQLKAFETSIDNAYKAGESVYLKGGAAKNTAIPTQAADAQPSTPYAPTPTPGTGLKKK